KKDNQNDEIWENLDEINSLKAKSYIADLELEINKKEGRCAVHQITKEGFKVAQRGLQEYSDAELNSMRTENRNNLQVASSSAVTQARSGTLESQDHQKVQKDLNYKETFDDNGDIITDGLARLWRSQEEIFIYEQTGPPDVDDITDFYIHDYKLVRTMRDVLNNSSSSQRYKRLQ
ncbi:1813_t:CDS:2, partial [Paraglomus brasilianum]